MALPSWALLLPRGAIQLATTQFPSVPPELVGAVVYHESRNNQYAVRHEPGWKYLKDVEQWATKMGTSVDSEVTLQSISWGYMQVMGSVAREMGYSQPLMLLATHYSDSVWYGTYKLELLRQEYGNNWPEVLAAYNAGSDRFNADGTFKNQAYVDDVMANYTALGGK